MQAIQLLKQQHGEAKAAFQEIAAADALQAQLPQYCALLVKEAHKSFGDAISEVREAIDFLRYYADEAERLAADGVALNGRGVFVCISPWNFPLAIFAGQVVAALAAGNAVAAKPAEQTPAVAAECVKLLHGSGVFDVHREVIESLGGRILFDQRVSTLPKPGGRNCRMLGVRAKLIRHGDSRKFDVHEDGHHFTRIILDEVEEILGFDRLFPILEGATHTENVIYSTSTAQQDRVDGDNEVKVIGADLGLAETDAIISFTELQPKPASPMYLFSIGDGSEGNSRTRTDENSAVKAALNIAHRKTVDYSAERPYPCGCGLEP